VLRKLAAQARTRHELAQALRTKRVPAEAAEAVLDRFQELGLVDDGQFAQDWVESRQARRHLSRTALRRELSAKGIDRDQIEEALAPVTSEEELTAARQLAEKKLRSMGKLDAGVRYRRLAGALARRGFGSGVISTVLDDLPSTPQSS
jgi:regulatory protein